MFYTHDIIFIPMVSRISIKCSPQISVCCPSPAASMPLVTQTPVRGRGKQLSDIIISLRAACSSLAALDWTGNSSALAQPSPAQSLLFSDLLGLITGGLQGYLLGGRHPSSHPHHSSTAIRIIFYKPFCYLLILEHQSQSSTVLPCSVFPSNPHTGSLGPASCSREKIELALPL